MINLTTLAGKPIAVNFDNVRYIESVPDTIICFSDGSRIVVVESVDQIKEKLIEFKQKIFTHQKELL